MGALGWVLGMAVHGPIISVVVAPIISPERRASAYGFVTTGYGIFWFLGSMVLGLLDDQPLNATLVLCMTAQSCAIPVFSG